MNVKHEQFIGIYENAFSKEYCDRVIALFDNLSLAGYTVSRQEWDRAPKAQKEDDAVFCNIEGTIAQPLSADLQKHFNEVFWGKCYPHYAEQNWILKDCGPHHIYTFKIQKTEPGQGYHIWHCEADTRLSCQRVLAWTLYLNNVDEGGETEFIYQKLRIKAQTGTLVIWPAGFTHTHRGNPPLSNTKYIVTGWVEF